MGFYGNITNVNKSTFQFDKIYPNRKEMDDACAADGVFIGRYVLVDYNTDSILGYVHAQVDDELKNKPVVVGYQEKRWDDTLGEYEILDDRFYNGIPKISDDKSSILEDRLYVIGENNIGISVAPDTLLLCLGYIKTRYSITTNAQTGDQVLIWTVEGIENNNYNPQIFLADGNSGEFIFLKNIDEIWDENKGRFVINHQIDAQFYGDSIGRGWDSTVWQKVYKDGNVAYVMIAELNSVVPTFDIVADAPTPIPQKPYYDSDSSTVYYKLHLQPSWGLRIKAAKDAVYSNGIELPSDENDNYYITTNTPIKRDLAVYWFNDGFHKYIEKTPEINENSVRLTPTGYSGNTYYDKNNAFGKTAIDTYELSLMLPSIGQTVSKLWNIIYGPGTYRDILGNRLWNKAALDFNMGEESDFIVADEEKNIKIRNTSLEWNTRNGVRAYWNYGSEESPELTYNKLALNNLAGTINSAHDLMGMIIIEDDDLLMNINPALSDPSNIYYDKTTNKYYRKGKKYSFTNDNLVGISGSNMFDPKDGSHYRLKSYPYDNYDDIYALNKESETPVYEQVINNYYKVKQTDTLYENEVYGTVQATRVSEFNIENFDSSATRPADYLWWYNSANGCYTHEVDDTPRDKPYYKLTVTELTGDNKPVFYTPRLYYLMKKDDFETVQARQDWEASNVRNNIDFNYLAIMNEDTLVSALASANINVSDENRLVGYKILKGVTVDPTRSSYILVDTNRRLDEETPAEDENISEIDDILTYSWNGFSATLQAKEDIVKVIEVDGENVNVPYYRYDISVFRSKNHSNLGSKTLKEWKEYIETESLEAEDFKDLVPDINLVKRITDPFYTLSNATDIRDIIHDVDSNGYTGYYFFYPKEVNPTTSEVLNEDYYRPISQGDVGSIQAQREPWYELDPVLVAVYYDLSGGYYINNNNDYLRETASLLLSQDSDILNLEYYSVVFTPETKTAFIPNLYYYKNGNNYVLATSFDSSKTYYRYIDKFVANDSNGVYDIGARWNEEVDAVAASTTVKAKTFQWEFQEIPDFAKDMNTLHGLILKINQMLLAGDMVTRDNQTVQGCINLINDILDKFDQLKPAEIIMVDKLGRIHSGDWDSKQKLGYTNVGKPSASVAEPAGNPGAADDGRWLRLTTTSGSSPDFKPHITLEHTVNNAADTTTTANKNADAASNGDGLNGSTGDSISLYTPIIDSKGHVIGKNTETVTLPYGFKTITGNNGSLVADNTQDTAAFSGDTWIQTTASSSGIVFTHVGPETTLHTTVNPATPGFGKTFDIVDWTFDTKGHKANSGSHTVTIPAPSITGTGNLVNNVTLDANGNFALTKEYVGALALTNYSEALTNPLIASTNTINEAFKIIENVLDNSSMTVNTRIATVIGSLDADLDASGASAGQNVTSTSTINAMSGVTEVDGTITSVDSILVDAAGAAAAAKSEIVGSSTDTYEDLTLNGLKRYVESMISQSVISDNFWGIQTPISADVSISSAMAISGAMNDSNVVAINLSDTGSTSYGTAYYLINNSGEIEIQTAGLYKVHGSLVVSAPQNSMVKAWISKNESGTLTSIAGISEYTGTGGAAAQILGFSDKLVELNAGDTIGLRAGCSATGATVKKNDLSYILLEMIQSSNINNGGGE